MSIEREHRCGDLELDRSQAWAAHAAIERWQRTADSEEIPEHVLERSGDVLASIEHDESLARDEMALLRDVCADAAPAEATPDRDREALRVVGNAAQRQLDSCFA